MRFFNIDKALELPQTFNVMHEALDDLYAKRQEEFQKTNPLTYIYKMVSLNQFQKSYGSSTGFKQAFEGTVDYATATGFTNGDGFRFTIGYKPFSGKVVFTWQALLEADPKGVSETLSDYQTAWHRQIVEYGMYALTGFFGGKVYDPVSKTYIQLTSADTPDGDTMNTTKNPVFYKDHTVVRREGMSTAEFDAMKQSNKFYINVALDGSDPLAYAKLANGLYQIKVRMNKFLDDNGKRAGVRGRKSLVMTEDAHLNMAIKSVLAATDFSDAVGRPTLNPIKGDFDIFTTSYLDGNYEQAIPQFATTDGLAKGILMLDKEYNTSNKGPMMVERVPFSLKPVKTDDPEGIKYMAKQAFDFFCPSWRGIAYVYIGLPAGGAGEWDQLSTFTEIVPVATAMAVTTVDPVVPTTVTDEMQDLIDGTSITELSYVYATGVITHKATYPTTIDSSIEDYIQDAIITFDDALPAATVVSPLTYNGGGLTASSKVLTGRKTVWLSELATQLDRSQDIGGHAGLSTTMAFTVAGNTSPIDTSMTVQHVISNDNFATWTVIAEKSSLFETPEDGA